MKETSPKDHRLFHYTPKLEYLDDMLTNGLWPRYCEEDFDWLVGGQARLAIPMVCFCDIPLKAAGNHRQRYGSYAISINKSWSGVLDINPVWYVHQESTIGKHIRDSINRKPRFSAENNQHNAMFKTLAYIKPAIGFQADRVIGGDCPPTEILAFDEEMEWRHTPSALFDFWRSASRPGFVLQEDRDRSKSHRLRLAVEHVENIFVPTIKDKTALTETHAWLDGKILTWDEQYEQL